MAEEQKPFNRTKIMLREENCMEPDVIVLLKPHFYCTFAPCINLCYLYLNNLIKYSMHCNAVCFSTDFFFLLILFTVFQHPFCTIGFFCRQDGELYAFLPLVPADKNLKQNPPYPPSKYMQTSRCQSTGCVALNVLRSSVWSVLIVIKCTERCFLIESCLIFWSSQRVFYKCAVWACHLECPLRHANNARWISLPWQ